MSIFHVITEGEKKLDRPALGDEVGGRTRKTTRRSRSTAGTRTTFLTASRTRAEEVRMRSTSGARSGQLRSVENVEIDACTGGYDMVEDRNRHGRKTLCLEQMPTQGRSGPTGGWIESGSKSEKPHAAVAISGPGSLVQGGGSEASDPVEIWCQMVSESDTAALEKLRSVKHGGSRARLAVGDVLQHRADSGQRSGGAEEMKTT